jgi:hypothetical protein
MTFQLSEILPTPEATYYWDKTFEFKIERDVPLPARSASNPPSRYSEIKRLFRQMQIGDSVVLNAQDKSLLATFGYRSKDVNIATRVIGKTRPKSLPSHPAHTKRWRCWKIERAS